MTAGPPLRAGFWRVFFFGWNRLGWVLRPLSLWWVLSFLVALGLGMPFFLRLADLVGGGALDPETPWSWYQLLEPWMAMGRVDFAWVLIAIAFWVLISLFMHAGVLGVLAGEPATGWAAFFGLGRRFLFSTTLVSAFSLVLGVGVVVGPYLLLDRLIQLWAWEGLPHWLLATVQGARFVLCFWLFSWAARVLDYSRILVCGRKPNQPVRAFFHALGFTGRRQVSTAFMWLVYVLLGLGLAVLNRWLEVRLFSDVPLHAGYAVALAQVFVLLRLCCRVARLASETIWIQQDMESRASRVRP